MFKSLLLIGLLILCDTQSIRGTEKIVHRVNYGVLFRHVAEVDNTEQKWPHTFEVQLPSVQNINIMPAVCPSWIKNKTVLCHTLKDTLSELFTIKTETIRSVSRIMTKIEKVLPIVETSYSIGNGRVRRAPFSFIADLSKSLFGTATVKDVQILASHINEMNKRQRDITHMFQVHTDELSSFMTATDTRITNAFNGIKQNHDILQQLDISVQNSLVTVSRMSNLIMKLLSRSIVNALTLQRKVDDLYYGVQTLLQGKLSPYLIPADVLSRAIARVNYHVNLKYPGYSITQNNIDYYYGAQTVIFARNFDSLFITLNFPISSSTNVFQVYQVLAFPVPLNTSTTHATQLLSHPSYFAKAEKNDYFIEIPSFHYDQCVGSNRKHCPFLLPKQKVTQPSCLSAIFYNNDNAHDICNFRYVHAITDSSIIEIEPGHILLSNINVIEIDCPNVKSQKLKGCVYCVVKVPCTCTLIADNFHLSARIDTCISDVKQNVTKYFPINLALLKQYFSKTDLAFLKGDTLTAEPLAVGLPSFDIYSHNFSNIIAADQKIHLSLKRMASQAKQNKVIYEHMTDPLLSGELTLDSPIFDLATILSIVSTALASIALVCIFIIFTKFKTLSNALILLSSASSTKALNVVDQHHLVWHPKHNELSSANGTLNTPQPNFSKFEYTFILQIVFCVFTVLTLFFLLCKIFRRNHVLLNLQLTNGRECVQFNILKLNMCPSY